jgi:hypothetical protein
VKLSSLYGNCAGCGLLFSVGKLKGLGRVRWADRELWCPSCLAKERFKRHLARVEELRG